MIESVRRREPLSACRQAPREGAGRIWVRPHADHEAAKEHRSSQQTHERHPVARLSDDGSNQNTSFFPNRTRPFDRGSLRPFKSEALHHKRVALSYLSAADCWGARGNDSRYGTTSPIGSEPQASAPACGGGSEPYKIVPPTATFRRCPAIV